MEDNTPHDKLDAVIKRIFEILETLDGGWPEDDLREFLVNAIVNEGLCEEVRKTKDARKTQNWPAAVGWFLAVAFALGLLAGMLLSLFIGNYILYFLG